MNSIEQLFKLAVKQIFENRINKTNGGLVELIISARLTKEEWEILRNMEYVKPYLTEQDIESISKYFNNPTLSQQTKGKESE